MNNNNAYLIVIPSGQIQGNLPDTFKRYFEQLQSKQEIAPGVWVGYSDVSLRQWYTGFQGAQTPMIFPIDLEAFDGVTGFSGPVQTLLNSTHKAA